MNKTQNEQIDITEIPSESWFEESEKKVQNVYISSLTCEEVDEDYKKKSSFEHFKCTFCERSDHCYKNSLSFDTLLDEEHIKTLENLPEAQIEDILYDLERTTYHCGECGGFNVGEDTDISEYSNEPFFQEDHDCDSCEGKTITGFHYFILQLQKVTFYDTSKIIERFINVKKNNT